MTGIPSTADTHDSVVTASDDSSSFLLDFVNDPIDDPSPVLLMAPKKIPSPRHVSTSLSNVHSQQSLAWDLPPVVASPCTKNRFETTWKTRSTRLQTPQHMSTVVLLSDVGDAFNDINSNSLDSSRMTSLEGVNAVGGEPNDVSESKLKSPEPVKQDKQKMVEVDLASTTSSYCAPVIWKERYLIVAVDPGEIRVYGNLLPTEYSKRIHHQLGGDNHDETIAPPGHTVTSIHIPLTTLILESDATIIQLLPMEEKDTIVALSTEGHVYVIKWMSDEKLELYHSWMTRDMGTTCMTAITKENQSSLLFIGYNSGIIDCWNLHDETGTPNTSPSITPSRKPKRKRPDCLWRGTVPDHHTVQSLATIPTTRKITSRGHDDDRSMPVVADDVFHGVGENVGEVNDTPRPKSEKHSMHKTLLHLIAITQPLIGEDPPVVHAFDLDAINGHRPKESVTSTLRIRDDTSSHVGSRTSSFLTLASFRVLPDPAMGILEPQSHRIILETDVSTNDRIDNSNSHGSNVDNDDNLRSIPAARFHVPGVVVPHACRAMSVQGSPVVLVTTWNGMVAQLSPGWGVRREHDQLLFSYPVVSMGSMMYQNKLHCVFGLRGGTCYVIPVVDESEGDDDDDDEKQGPPTIRVIPYPHDIDVDNDSIYVQELTAGTLLHGNDGSRLSVLVYVLPGGILEIYSCDTVTSCSDDYSENGTHQEEDQVLEALVQQGCLDSVLRLLLEGNDSIWDDDVEVDRRMWIDAWEEVLAATPGAGNNGTNDNVDQDKQTSRLMSTKDSSFMVGDLRHMPALRKLLLELAKIT